MQSVAVAILNQAIIIKKYLIRPLSKGVIHKPYIWTWQGERVCQMSILVPTAYRVSQENLYTSITYGCNRSVQIFLAHPVGMLYKQLFGYQLCILIWLTKDFSTTSQMNVQVYFILVNKTSLICIQIKYILNS